jgi:hypothetical protein
MSKWRERYKVHPVAELFPMMSGEELVKFGEDIRANGLKVPLDFQRKAGRDVLLDGRNRLEAMERAGVSCSITRRYIEGDAIAHIISLNLKRRHLTKEQQAELILKGVRSSRQHGEMIPKRHAEGKRGSEKDIEKAHAVEIANEHGISKRTVERASAKAAGREPPPPKRPTLPAGLKAAREQYAAEFAKLPVSGEDAEWKRLAAAIDRAKGKS